MIRTVRRMGQATSVQLPSGALYSLDRPADDPALTVAYAPVTAAQQVAAAAVTATSAPPPAPVSYASAEIPGSIDYTADLETVANLMSQYGDTWDDAQTIVNAMYAAGMPPGSVSQASALPYLTGVTTATAAATTATTGFTLPSLPWYAWAGIAVGGVLLLGGGRK